MHLSTEKKKYEFETLNNICVKFLRHSFILVLGIAIVIVDGVQLG